MAIQNAIKFAAEDLLSVLNQSEHEFGFPCNNVNMLYHNQHSLISNLPLSVGPAIIILAGVEIFMKSAGTVSLTTSEPGSI